MEKLLELSLLYDIYSPLLTETQRQVFDTYHHEDLSLNEVAKISGISKQAVSENLKRAEANLYDFERKMQLVDKTKHYQNLVQALLAYQEDPQRRDQDLEQIFRLARQLKERM